MSSLLERARTVGKWSSLGMRLGKKIDRCLFNRQLGRFWKEVGDKKRTRLDWMRFAQLAHFAREVERQGIPGDYAEFGVWRGGSLYLIAQLWKRSGARRALLGFDSFEGLPEPDPARDGHVIYKGMFGDTDYEETKRFFETRGLDSVTLVKGWFHETLGMLKDRRIALCHVDADLYESIKLVLETVYPRLSPGGYVIFDDYRHPDCSGATIAVEEFFARRPEIIRQWPYLNCTGYVRKPLDVQV